MHKRSNKLELMDLGPAYYSHDEYYTCLRKLGTIGKFFGAHRAMIRAFNSFSPFTSILDVGCGGGEFTAALAAAFPQARVVGTDIDQQAIQYAKTRWKGAASQYEFRAQPQLQEPAKSVDVLTATLVCHHLTDAQLIDFLQRATRVSRKAIILNDLHRSSIAFALFYLIAPFFFSRMTRYDGLISIRRGFRRAEWEQLLAAAGFSPEQYTIRWHWPFRWIVTVDVG